MILDWKDETTQARLGYGFLVLLAFAQILMHTDVVAANPARGGLSLILNFLIPWVPSVLIAVELRGMSAGRRFSLALSLLLTLGAWRFDLLDGAHHGPLPGPPLWLLLLPGLFAVYLLLMWRGWKWTALGFAVLFTVLNALAFFAISLFGANHFACAGAVPAACVWIQW